MKDPAKPQSVHVNAEAIPEEMKTASAWLCWRWEHDSDRGWTKVPISARTLKKIDINDPSEMVRFEEAIGQLQGGSADGVGISLGFAGLLGVDLDDCRDPDTGEIDRWANEIIGKLNSYTEISPSGTGVKIFLRAAKPGPKCRTGDVEMYDAGRFFTVTGLHLRELPKSPQARQEAIDALYDELFPEVKPGSSGMAASQNSLPMSDAELLQKAFRAKNGEKVRRLWEGATSEYPSRSEADLALCSLLAFYVPDPARLDALFRQSALYRKKWEREDYRVRTISKALEGRTEFYQPRSGSCVLPRGTNEEAAEDDRPVIVVDTEQGRVNDEAVRALARAEDVYCRGDRLVHVVESKGGDAAPAIRKLSQNLLQDRLSGVARWVKTVVDRNGEQRHVPIAPPEWCTKAVLDCGHWPGLRRLEGVVAFPVLVKDGTILDKSGYHSETGLLVWLDPNLEIDVPRSPTPDQVRAACETLFEIVQDFPFKTQAHRSAWLASALTPLARFAFDGPAPLFLIDSNIRGIGKGLLADTVSLTIQGCKFSPMAYPKDPAELSKVITSLSIQADRMVLFDNLTGPLGNGVLDAALTSDQWKDRLLGGNCIHEGDLTVTWYATGNNCQLVGDTARRTCHIRIETLEEKPENRTDFRYPRLRKHIEENRSRYLNALLTIFRGWYAAGQPRAGLVELGSFEGWSDLIRECIVFAGEPDPADTLPALYEQSDGEAVVLECLYHELHRLDPTQKGLTASDIISHSDMNPDLRSALCDVVEGDLDPRSLGRCLKSLVMKPVNGWHVKRVKVVNRGILWTVCPHAAFSHSDSPCQEGPTNDISA